MLEQYSDVMTTDECCQALRIGMNALYDLLNSGKLKAYRVGRNWRIPKIAVEEFIMVSSSLQKPLIDPFEVSK